MTDAELGRALEVLLDSIQVEPVQHERELSELALALGSGAAVVIRNGDLLSSKEAAALLGVDRTTVSRWRSSGYLPAPFDEVGAGPIWLRQTLEEFATTHRASADAAGRRPLGTAAR